MLRIFSIMLLLTAGFLYCSASMTGFMTYMETGEKVILMIFFSILATIILCGGLALTSFRNWKRDTGIVLLSGSGVMAAAILLWIAFDLAVTRGLVLRYISPVFGDYLTGGATIVGFAVLGWILIGVHGHSAAPYPHQ